MTRKCRSIGLTFKAKVAQHECNRSQLYHRTIRAITPCTAAGSFMGYSSPSSLVIPA